MKRMLFGGLMAGIFGILMIPTAKAINIDFVAQNSVVSLNDTVSVNIIVSGLETGGLDEIVSSFDLDITYDSSIVSSTGFTFGSELGFSFTSDFSSLGLIDIAEVSLETDPSLQASQGDSVNLGSLSFHADSVGTTSLDFVFDQFNLLTGLRADVLNIDSVNGSITVRDPNKVPLPSTLMLLGIGIFALGRVLRLNRI